MRRCDLSGHRLLRFWLDEGMELIEDEEEGMMNGWWWFEDKSASQRNND
jgi:hypothetical protein